MSTPWGCCRPALCLTAGKARIIRNLPEHIPSRVKTTPASKRGYARGRMAKGYKETYHPAIRTKFHHARHQGPGQRQHQDQDEGHHPHKSRCNSNALGTMTTRAKFLVMPVGPPGVDVHGPSNRKCNCVLDVMLASGLGVVDTWRSSAPKLRRIPVEMGLPLFINSRLVHPALLPCNIGNLVVFLEVIPCGKPTFKQKGKRSH